LITFPEIGSLAAFVSVICAENIAEAPNKRSKDFFMVKIFLLKIIKK
jgi:hypothetical protein